jgi:hypothetical protein
MSDIEGKAVKGSSERVWEMSEFQSRKLKRKLVDSFAPLCRRYPRGFAVYPTASQLRGVLASGS